MFLRYNQYSIALFILILLVTLIPGREVPSENMPHIDKVVHVSLFFLFTISSIVGFIKQFQLKWINRHACKFAIVFALVLGIVVEILQGAFVPLRAFDPMDMLANTAGVALGYGTYLFIKGSDDFHML